MNILKKSLSLTLVAAMCIGVSACGSSTENNSSSATATADSSAAAATGTDTQTTQESSEASESSESAAAEGGKIASIKEKGELVMGCSADFPPFEFHVMNDGTDEIVGYEVMIVKNIASELGVELVIKDMSFDSLIGGLNTGSIDIIASGMLANEEREKQVDFSVPYYFGDQLLIVRKDSVDLYKTAADFAGKTIGIQSGTMQENYANDQLVEPYGAKISLLTEIPPMIMQLKTGSLDAVLLGKVIAEAYIRQNSDDLVACTVPIKGGDYGIAMAVAKGNSDLLEVTDQTLNKLIEEGTLDTYMDEAIALARTNEPGETN